MTTHVGLMVVFALFVAVVFAALLRDDPPAQLRFAAQVFGALVGGGLLLAWLLYPLPL